MRWPDWRKGNFEHVQELLGARTGDRCGGPSGQDGPGERRSGCPTRTRRAAGGPARPRSRSTCAARTSSCTRGTCAPRAVLDELAAYAPVRAVRGNNDGPDVAAWGAPDTLELDLDGLRAGHDPPLRPGGLLARPGCAAGSPARSSSSSVTRTSRSTRDRGPSGRDGQRIFNPGSPTDRRRQPQGTIGVLDIEDGELVSARIVAVTPPPGVGGGVRAPVSAAGLVQARRPSSATPSPLRSGRSSPAGMAIQRASGPDPSGRRRGPTRCRWPAAAGR